MMVMLNMWRRALVLTLGLSMIALTGSRAVGGQERIVVEVLAERFTFTPSEIRVPAGATLELRVRSADTMHGFLIVGQGINIAVPKRRQGEAVVTFQVVQPGRYEFRCSRLCGAGHNFMRGEIIVEPEGADR